MPLRGELDSVDLAHVFQMLVLNEKAGTLEIVHEGAKRQLFFCPDGVRIPIDRELLNRRALRQLLRDDRVSRADLERARTNAAAMNLDEIDALVQVGALTPELRDGALRAELEEEVYELFFLKNATFEFRADEAPSGDAEHSLPLQATGIVMEAARRVDEWRYIQQHVHSGGDIIEALPDLSRFDARELGSDIRAVHDALNGIATVDAVIESTSICRFLVYRALALLIERGAARVVPTDELQSRARELLQSGKIADAGNVFELVIARGFRDVGVLSSAGQCWESQGQLVRAANRYLEAGQVAEEQGDLDRAIRSFLRVRELLPTQVDARIRLFALRKLVVSHVGRERYDAAKEGHELARILFEIGRKSEVREVLAGLMEMADRDCGAMERAADLAGTVQQPVIAVDAFKLAADRRGSIGDLSGALVSLKRAQAIDSTRDDLAQHVRVTQAAIERHRVRRTSTMRVLAMVGGFALCFFYYGRYSRAAMDAYGRFSIEDVLASKDFAAGRQHFDTIRSDYPLTIPFLLASEKLREIEVHERHHREVNDYRSQLDSARREKHLKQARSLRDSALEMRRTGDVQRALELMRKSKAYAGDGDPLTIESTISELENYLAGAARLRTEANFFRTAGRIDQAHQRLVELLDRFPDSPDAAMARLPVSIESVPSGARIRIEGKPVTFGEGDFLVEAETPFVVDLPPGDAIDLELTHDGNVPYVTRFQAVESPRIEAMLPRRPALEAMLPRALVRPLLEVGDTLYVALENGFVSALDASSLEVRWSQQLPGLAEISGELALLDERLFVPTSQKKILELAIPDGSLIREHTVPSKPESAVVPMAGRFAVRCEGGILAVGATEDANWLTQATAAPVIVGPIELPRERVVFACEDERIWLCGRDGTQSLLRGSGPIGRVTAMTVDGDTLWIGDRNGTLHAFDTSTQEQRCSIAVFRDQAIEVIAPDSKRPLVAGGGRVVVVDCVEKRIAQGIAERVTLVDSRGPRIGIITEEGTFEILRRSDLTVIGSYSSGEKLSGFGRVDGSRGWFAASMGRILGIGTESR